MAPTQEATPRRAWGVLLSVVRHGAFVPLPAELRRMRRAVACAVLGVLALAAGAAPLIPGCFALAAAHVVRTRFLNPGWSLRRERVAVGAGASVGTVAGLVVSALPHGLGPATWFLHGTGAAGGFALVPLVAWASSEQRWQPPDLLRRIGIRTRWSLLGVAPMVAVPCTAYVLAWSQLPDADIADAVRYGFVGVVAWPLAAAALRDELLLSALWPPWWAAAQVMLGVPITAAIVFERTGTESLPALGGVVAAGLLLAPVALWAHRHARRRSPGHLPRIGMLLSVAESLAPAFDPSVRYRILAHVARRRFNIGRAAHEQFDDAGRPAVERTLSTWFAFLDTWSLSRRQVAYLGIELGTLVVALLVPPVVVAAGTEPALSAALPSAVALYASILTLGALGRGKRSSPGRWIRLITVLILLEAIGVYLSVAWGARDTDLQRAFAAAVTMAGGAILALAIRWALLSVVPVRDWATVGKPPAVTGSTVLTAMYASLMAELAWMSEPWTRPMLRRDLAGRLLRLADWCERRLRILCPSAVDARSASAEGAEVLRTLRPWLPTMKNRTDYDRMYAEVQKLAVQAAGNALDTTTRAGTATRADTTRPNGTAAATGEPGSAGGPETGALPLR